MLITEPPYIMTLCGNYEVCPNDPSARWDDRCAPFFVGVPTGCPSDDGGDGEDGYIDCSWCGIGSGGQGEEGDHPPPPPEPLVSCSTEIENKACCKPFLDKEYSLDEIAQAAKGKLIDATKKLPILTIKNVDAKASVKGEICPKCCDDNIHWYLKAKGEGEGSVTLGITAYGKKFGPFSFGDEDEDKWAGARGEVKIVVAGISAEAKGTLEGSVRLYHEGCPPELCKSITGTAIAELTVGPEVTIDVSAEAWVWELEVKVDVEASAWANVSGSASITGKIDSCEGSKGSACVGPLKGQVGAKIKLTPESEGIAVGPYSKEFMEQKCATY